ncbi:DUF883 domain-containing protein [Stutzerimonas urumqiensis]|uniref:DUF883 family protein n=1 Tax=Stutzerimonas urumqiensis TaxID=638269 RepID=UPI003BAB80DE
MALEPTTPLPNDETGTTSQASQSHGALFDTEAHKRNLRTAQNALIEEFQTLIADTERLLKHTQDTAGTQAQELRTRISANISRAQGMMKEHHGQLNTQGQAAIQCTEEYVHTHPWQSLGIAAGVGFLLGLISARR